MAGYLWDILERVRVHRNSGREWSERGVCVREIGRVYERWFRERGW